MNDVPFFSDQKLRNFTVSIGRVFDVNNINPDSFHDCASDISYGNETKNVQCEQKVIGQYVRIKLEGEGILSLCEVNVYGESISG